MRRLATVLAATAAALWVAAPASAFAHANVVNPYVHTAARRADLGVVTAPLWTAYLWAAPAGPAAGAGRDSSSSRSPCSASPVLDPAVHATALVGALAVTVASIVVVRRAAGGQRSLFTKSYAGTHRA